MTSTETLLQHVAHCVPENGLRDKLQMAEKKNRKLIVKLGFDPTAPDLHLGHAIVLKKMRQFQELGHQIIVIVGDFTALIGDPTGRNKTRPPLSEEEVAHNAQTYIAQLDKILDISKIQVRHNREWLGKLNLRDLVSLLSKLTVSQILQRNDFAERYENNVAISMHEILYPVMQAYDSLEINADIELGGTDQLFNCLMGRQLQEAYEKAAQIVMCMTILPGTDGVEKMSKSKHNYIGLTEPANEMYGKVMSVPDNVLKDYFELCSEIDPAEQKKILNDVASGALNPMEAKKKLAFDIVRQYHDAAAAETAAQHFYNQVQNRDLAKKQYTDKSLADLNMKASETVTLLELCSRLEPEQSKSALRRLIEAGSASIEGDKVMDPQYPINLKDGLPVKLKLGKRGFYNITT